jgi:hypothetical protein
MKRIFCVIAVVLFLLPLALSSQDFNPAAGPLEGDWENEVDEEAVIVFTGNLFLERNWGSTYTVFPGMKYGNGNARSSTEPEYAFNYELSGNSLTLTDEYNEDIHYKRSGDTILQNKSALEGIWTTVYSDSHITGVLTLIFIGQLLIMSMEGDSFSGYSSGYEFTYSDTDHTITNAEGVAPCMVSGDTMTLGDDDESFVFTRKN